MISIEFDVDEDDLTTSKKIKAVDLKSPPQKISRNPSVQVAEKSLSFGSSTLKLKELTIFGAKLWVASI